MKQDSARVRSSNCNGSLRPIRAVMDSSAYDGLLAEVAARRERERPRLEAVYGKLNRFDISRILRVEDEQAECEGCSGTCHKDFFRYKKPIAKMVDGYLYVSNVPCGFGIDHVEREAAFRAGIPERFIGRKFADYRTTKDNIRSVKLAKLFLEKDTVRGLFMYGATGSGKTFLASLVALERLRDSKSVVFYDMPALLGKIKSTFDTRESTDDFIKKICNASLLVLDDVGAEKVTDWSVEQLYRIVNARYAANRPLIVTANFDIEGLERRLGGDVVAKRIISRLTEMCAQCFFGTVDWRTK